MTTVLITGASSGLGAALARHYAEPGVALFLGGRDAARLEAVAEICRDEGAEVHTACIDVTDAPAMAGWVQACEVVRPLDVVIANAGISAGTGGGGESGEQTRRIFSVNVEGVFNTVLPVIPLMRARHGGRIAIMSSLAGFRGVGSAPAYGASKAAVRVWGEGLRGWLRQDGIAVSVICPGFVDTPMTAVNRFPMPFRMDVDRAAVLIADGIAAGRGRIAFPLPMRLAVWLLSALPDRVADLLTRRLPGKD